MNHTEETTQAAAELGAEDNVLDILIIGAGVTGIYQLYRAREAGFDARVVDAAEGVGGTWYWNRYPGARFDSESYSYQYFFSQEVLDGWTWSEHFAGQDEIERYLNYTVDTLDLRPLITLGKRVEEATFDEQTRRWLVRFSDGQTQRSRFLVTAIGVLSAPQFPPLPGREDFAGESYHTALWPREPVDFAGKRVAVIGVGSSGVQLISAIADAVSELIVFQRSANWCVPLRNSPITPAEQNDIRRRLEEIHQTCLSTPGGFIHRYHEGSAFDHSEEFRHRLYEQLYEMPGFAKLLQNFREVRTNELINAEFSAFIEKKIRARIKDARVADMLVPRDHGYGLKRPPHDDSTFYETFNRENVHLVDLKATPIDQVTASSLVTTDAEFEVDMIVYATGFDAITGAFDRIDFNADGFTLKELWADGPLTFLGAGSPGFPNLFFLAGPQSTGGNVPRAAEAHVDFVTDLLKRATREQVTRIEVTRDAAESWTEHVLSAVEGSLAAKAGLDWSYGANTPGKKVVFRHYAGGLPGYLEKANECRANDFAGFDFS